MGNFIVCAGPPENGVAPNLNVNVNPESSTPEQAMPVIKDGLSKILTDYRSVDQGLLTIDGKKALFLSGKFKMGQFDLQNVQYAIFTGSKVYTITFTCLAPDFAKHRPAFEQSALTARVE